MFDASNPTHLAALKSEVISDPIGMGYNWEATQDTLKKLNDPANNVGGETVAKELDAEALLDVIDTGDFASNQVDQGERDWLRMVFDWAAQGHSIERWRQKITDIFQSNSDTVTNINSLTRPLSRAEVLFGAGVSISRNDWYAARDS